MKKNIRVKMIDYKQVGIIAIFLVFLMSACKNETEEGIYVEHPVPVTIQPIVKKNHMIVVQATGFVSTDNNTLLSFKNGGIIDKIYVKEGDYVKNGQVLAKLNMTGINAQAAQAKLGLEKANRDFERAEKLYHDSVATREQYENAKTALDVMEQDWKTIQFNLKYSEIRATMDGYILLKLASEGQMVGPGTPIFRLDGSGKGGWLVEVGVSDRQWAEVQIGDSAVVTTDVTEAGIPAKIIRRSEGLNPQSGTFTIYLQLETKEKLPIATGMFAKVKIFGNSTNSWSIPYESMLNGDHGEGYVFVTENKKTAKKIKVKIGSIETDRILISSGLKDYKYLVVAGSPYLKDGSEIKVIKN